MESQITGVESVLRRTVSAHGVVEWDILSRHVTVRSTEHQEGENQVFQGEEVEVVVQQAEVAMGGMETEIKRNKVMQKC